MQCRHCARILLSVLQTLLHGAFVWLQPRSPVVVVVVESGRGPEDPDARVVAVASGRRAALAVHVSLPALGESQPAAGENPLQGVREAHGSHRRADPAAAPPDAKEADARAVVGRAAAGRAARGRQVPESRAAVVLAAEHSLP
jgi:hypothetical protein